MNSRSLLSGIAIGAGLMYMLDPETGSRRRRFVKDKARSAYDKTGDIAHSAQSTIRDKFGRGNGGDGVDQAVDQARTAVEDMAEEGSFLGRNYGRILAGTAGGALAYYALRRRGAVGTGLGAAGVGLMAAGIRGRRRMREQEREHFESSVHIDAPVEQVYQFWARFENFPRFMPQLKEVRDLGNGRSHWVASGPAGAPVEWDAIVTEHIPNRQMGWKSLPESSVETEGTVFFERAGRGTNLRVQMSYSPPGGKVGHKVAQFLGSDPQRLIEENLNRIKPLLERSGQTGGQPEPVEQHAQQRGGQAGQSR
jgi:uncharacterized membrane protein